MSEFTPPPRATNGAYVIRFNFPESTVYAGWKGDALGWAPTGETAARFESREIAERTLQNSYGDGTRPFGEVIEL